MRALPMSPRLAALLKRLASFYSAALAMAAAAFWAFAELADEVLERSTARFDREVILAWHAQAHPVWDQLALVAAAVGDVPAIVALGALFGAYLARRRLYADLAGLAAAVIGGGVLTFALKAAFRQPRPALFEQLVHEVTYSFPSGHSLMSFCLFGYFGAWLVSRQPRSAWRWLVAVGLVGLAAGIAASRVYLGVHWPSDVIAGAIAATCWLSICLVGRRFLSSRTGWQVS
ncbi:MAG: phosphatase PAP2 family protein [Candidatus Sericytochromatia bacterium]